LLVLGGGACTLEEEVPRVSGNDTCESAAPLPSGGGLFAGSMKGLQDDFPLSCSGGAAPDAVYTFAATERSRVWVRSFGEAKPTVALQIQQGGCGGTWVQCDKTTTSGVLSSTTVEPQLLVEVGPGEYTLLVDSGVDYTLRSSIGPVREVSGNDGCEAAYEIPPEGGIFKGDLRKASDDVALPCGTVTSSAPHPDVVFTFQLTEALRVVINNEPEYGQGDPYADTVLSLRRGSCEGAEVLCHRDSSAGSSVMAGFDRILTPGRYYLHLDTEDSNNAGPTGLYRLDVRFLPPTEAELKNAGKGGVLP
jgi:hypothetical protein